MRARGNRLGENRTDALSGLQGGNYILYRPSVVTFDIDSALASDDAGYMHGSAMVVDGGFTAQ